MIKLRILNETGPTELMLDSSGVLEQIDTHPTHWLFVDGVMPARESIQTINWGEVQSVDLIPAIVGSAYDYDKKLDAVVHVRSCGNCGTFRTIPSKEKDYKCKNPNCPGPGGQKIEGRKQMWIEELGKVVRVNSCGHCGTTRTIPTPNPDEPRKNRCKNPNCPGPGQNGKI